MADEQATTTDVSGINRTSDGQITTQTPDSSTTTTTQQTSTTENGQTLLTEKPAESKTETKPEAKAEGAPEKYEDYKVPEGYTLDPEIRTAADALFKNLGLSQEGAQSLVDFYIKQTQEAFQAPFDAYQEMTDGWRKDAEDHPDLRGKLGEGKEVNIRIGRALDSLNDPQLVSDFKALMDLTGAGNHQAFIRVIDKLAARVTEGSHVVGNGPAKGGQAAPNQAPPTAAGALWPTLPSASDRR